MTGPDRRRWLIRKATGGMGAAPFDTKKASIIGPDTEPIELVPASEVDRLVNERLSSLADDPQTRQRVAEALNRWTFAQYEKQVFSDLPDAADTALSAALREAVGPS